MAIAGQISRLQREISRYNEIITTNNQNITRLEKAKSKIVKNQNELSMEKSKVDQPQLSNETWRGKHANEFMEMRTKLKHTYNDMVNNQVEVLLENIDQAIQDLKRANSNLLDSIESSRHRIRNLR